MHVKVSRYVRGVYNRTSEQSLENIKNNLTRLSNGQRALAYGDEIADIRRGRTPKKEREEYITHLIGKPVCLTNKNTFHVNE